MKLHRSARVVFLSLAAFLFSSNWFMAAACTVSMTPASATLYAGQSQQFTASVDEPGKEAVTWSISPAVGSIGTTGLYTAPATISKQQTVTVTATNQMERDKSASATITLMPGKVTPVMSWSAPPAITYGTALGAAQLEATASVPGSFVYSPVAGTVLAAGSQKLSVTFTPTNTTLYNSATDSVTLTVNKATPVINWSRLAAIPYGTTLSSAQLDATANHPGTFVYSPAAGTELSIGIQTLSVIFTPNDTSDYFTASDSVTLRVYPPPVLVTVTPATAILYAGQTQQFTSNVSNNDGSRCGKNGVKWTISPAVGTISSTGLYTAPATISKQQTVTVTATSEANPNKSGMATITLAVGTTIPTITWATPAAITYGAALSATQLDASLSVAGSCVYTPAAGTILSAGTQTLSVTCTPIDTTDYATPPAKTVSLIVSQAVPVITWSAPAAITYGTALSRTQLDASLSVAGSCVYSPASGTVLSAGTQTLSVICTPTDTTDYATPAAKTVPLIVSQAAPVITWTAPAAITYGTTLSGTQLDAILSVAGSCVYTPAAGTILRAGTQTLSVTCTPTDTTDYATPAAKTVPLTVSQAVPVITWAAPAAITYGTALSGTQLDAILSVAGSCVYTPAAGTILSAGTQILSATCTPTDTTDYATPPAKTVPLTVSQATAVITWAAPAAITYGTVLSGTQLDASLSVAGSCVYTPTAGTVLSAGTQTLSVTCTPTDTTDYATPQADAVQLTVSQASPVITWATPAAINFGTALSATQLDANSTVAGTFAYTPAAGTVLAAGTQTLSVNFTPTDTIDYSSAADTVTLTVNPAQCASIGYSYQRAIVIDHTQVPNTDQINFPFLFNTTDPLLATTANNGHVTSPNGYDIIFTSDPGGQSVLNYEMEEYSPANGQVIAWVKIPTLSHTKDTIIYMFYGNSSITTSQQNPTGVWDTNYMGVWHLANGTTLSANDSTVNGNNGTVVGATATAGKIDGGMNNPSVTSGYIDLSSTALAAMTPSAFSLEAWVNLSGIGGYPAIVDFDANNSNNMGLYVEGGSGIGVVIGNRMPLLIPSSSIQAGWNHIVATWDGQSPAMYLNGVEGGTGWNDSNYGNGTASAAIGLGYSSELFNGLIDEVRVSTNIARSADWIAAEYNNQNSPQMFFALTQEGLLGTLQVVPATVNLYAAQSQQFVLLGMNTCSPVAVNWTVAPTGVGTISQTGIYTAPSPILTQQEVTVTATTTENNNSVSATVTLMPSQSGPAGTILTVNGAGGFGSAEGASNVTVGGLPAVTLLWSDTQIQIQIPTGTGLGTKSIVISVAGQPDTETAFTVTPGLVGITPPSTGLPASTTINLSNQSAPLIFYGTAGQLASVSLYNSNFGGWCNPGQITILNPDGSTLINQGICNGSTTNPVVTLPATGIYTLIIAPSNNGATGSASVTLWLFSEQSGTITPGTPVTSTINIPGQENLLTFFGTAGQLADVSLIDSTYSGWCNPAQITVLNPDGSILINQGICNGSTTNPVVTLPATGIYTLIVVPSNNGATGSASVTLWLFNNLVGTITSGIPVTPSINIPGQEELLTFNGTAGQLATVSLFNSSFGGWCNPGQFTILNPDGSTLINQGICNGSTTNPVVTLPSAGTYTLVVTPGNYGTTGGASVTLWLFGEETGTIKPGASITSTIDIPGQEDLLTFFGTAGQLADVSLFNSSFGGWCNPAQITILNPDGSTLINQGICNGSTTNPVATLPTTGTYTLIVSPGDYGDTGSASFTLWLFNNLVGTITSGVPVTPTINIPGQEELLTFSGLAGQSATVSLFNSSFGGWCNPGQFTILNPDGSILVSQGVCNGGTTSPAATLPTTGTYTLVVSPGNYGTTGSGMILLIESNSSVTVTPSNLNIYGGLTQQFTANMPVNWSASAGTIDNTGLFTASVNLTSNQLVAITAASLADPTATASAIVWVYPPATLTPLTATLIGGQTQQFAACMASATNSMVCGSTVAEWTISPAGTGTITSSGLYTAPAAIPTTQAVVITATDLSDPLAIISATVTLIPPTVNVSPVAQTLYSGQTEQFFAQVQNSSNTAVTWSVAPAGAGFISASGLYTAPLGITSQQTVTITAASQAVPTVTASATVTLSPAQCAGQAYGYERSIVIDHTKVTDSDQLNFPFYFAVTDPLLATTANGGHMVSSSGNDIQFSTDPAGLKTLNYELEQYNPATGQLVAWVRVPVLSHTQDTVIYMFYGNASIAVSQQNPVGVWDSNYAAVYQFDNAQPGLVLDSTVNDNNASGEGLQKATGEPGGAASFDGATSYIELPANDFASYPVNGSSGAIFNSTVGVWFKTSSSGVILGQSGSTTPGGNPGGWVPALYIDTNGYLRANFFDLQNAQQIVSSTPYNDNNWHYAVLSFNTDETTNTIGSLNSVTSTTSGRETVYLDGQVIGSQDGLIPTSFNSAYSYFLGTGFTQSWAATSSNNNSWFYFNGSLDQVEISSIARSGDWVRAEYLNQSAPSAFFALSPEAVSGGSLNPLAVTLYAQQSQQFTVLEAGMCNAGYAVYSMPAGSPGTLSPTGLYTSPTTINTQQTVTVTATTLGANSTELSSTITLMPPVGVTVLPGLVSLPAGGTQQFTANVTNTTNMGVTWTLNPAGVGTISASGLYTSPASVSALQTVNVIATSLADPTQSAAASVTLGVATPSVPAIAVTPQSTILYAGNTQQFTAAVTNAGTIDVTWSISPAGMGSIDGTGFYTAPAAIPAQQTVIITATSQADPAVAAMATVALMPAQCTSNGYSYIRAITINSAHIPNTDQANFPFLFSTTDPLLATTANGGHVTSSNGYDIVFTSDSAGQNPLNYEMETYNSGTGQVIAWIQIPVLSHTSDTVIYMFYGNPSVTTSQQNATGAWDSNYGGVWHLNGNGTVISTADSTANANNATLDGSASVAPGQIGNGAALSGTGHFDAGNQPTVQPTHTGTMSVWINPLMFSGYIIPIGNGDTSGFPEYGAMMTLGSNGSIQFRVDGTSWIDGNSVSSNPLISNRWDYLTATWDGTNVNLYINGALAQSTGQSVDASPCCDLIFGWGLYGEIEEARVSGIARSADWIAAEYANQNSPSTFYTQSAENLAGIAPNSVSLYANQSQQFAAPGLCSAGVTWSLSSDTEGTLTPSGLYTAPAAITEQQTVTVTATSQSSSGQSASATVTLLPAVSIAVSPVSITLSQNQTQQFTATVSNSLSQAVTWTMSPAGLGSLDQTGAYIAPPSILTQQTVTITATSQTDPTKSASAMITLAPSTCASTGYGYQRVIVIDHTKVANTDQINYPFLFNSTDRDLASVDNGGHVISANGSDIIFSSDPNGQTRLDFEVEQYNPATGQMVAWIRIPMLSHSADTLLYVFYGNPSITASQANPGGVWDSNYKAVYHLGNLPSTEIATDSTSYINNATFNNLAPEFGVIDGAASLDGITSYLEIPATAFPNYPTGVYNNIGVNTTWNNTAFTATYGIWFKTASWGGLLDQTAGDSCTGIFGICLFAAPEQPGTDPDGSWGGMLDVNFNGNLEGRGVGASTQTYNDNNWHYAAITFENGVNNLYADGQLVSTGSQGTFGFSPNYAYFVGTEDIESDTSSLDSRPWRYLNGKIDEINVSNTARSGDWIQTQYNNQSSPSTFYTFYSPTAIQVAPSAISLYAAQSEQFTVPGTCDATIAWSLPSGSFGTLTSTGLYTAPSAISSQQTITVSATSQSNSSSLGSAQVTLLPAPQPLTLIASSPSPYQAGSSQNFTATLLDPQGNPRIGVTVNFMVAGVNATVGSAATAANGTASFSYTGTNAGSDTVQATASVEGALLTSNSLTAAWLTPPPVAVPTVTLLPQPSPGRGALIGAFTDNNGNLIEPIVVGTAARTFITPVGATQLQLGIDDNYYPDNAGAGFVVAVNGVNVTVPATAQPWNWHTGGLNNNYQFGINDGSNPVVGAANLTVGQPVSVAYQSGTVTSDTPLRPLVDANGEIDFTTGTQVWQGAYFPTLYTTGTAYPQSQPINLFAVVTDATGNPISNTPVTLSVTGANPGQYQAVSDATGTASFLYTGQYAGNDSLQAQAVLNGGGTLNSNQATIDWTNYPTPPPVGSLSFTSIVSVVNSQDFSSFARDASGNPLENVNVGFYVSGVDNFQSSSSTNDIGQASFSYYHTQSGNYSIIAVDSVGRNVIVTPAYTNSWVVPVSSQSSGGSGDAITVGISAATTVAIPNTLQLNGTATDNQANAMVTAWSQVSGPGVVTFANPASLATTASFSDLGRYVLQLTASDALGVSASTQIAVLVTPPIQDPQGWVGSPLYGSSVSGIIPITLAPGISIQPGGILTYYPANNTSNISTLPIIAESGTISTLDTTMLANGSYWIQLQATDTSGNQQYSLILVTVTGSYKPGRVTATVTDLVVPATGLSIDIQRSYDSLNAGASSDFGYGWNLGINVNLVVDNAGNVTFTLNGQRKTFYLSPTRPPCSPLIGCLFPWYYSSYTPEAGLHGTLSSAGTGCDSGLVFEFLIPDGSSWDCIGEFQFSPTNYVYTDPNGTSYSMSAAGNLQSIQDRNGNGLTITANGITSTSGLNVPFVRDAQNRITQITDPLGNIYSYGYDANGNLSTVTYPPTLGAVACQNTSATNTSTYTYNANHFYLTGTDGRCNTLPVTAYYDSTNDGGNSSLDGRQLSATNAAGNTTSYAYNLSTTSTINGVSVPNTGVTTVLYPDGGTATMIYDSNGDLLSSTDPLGNITITAYDSNRNPISVTDPLGNTTTSTYDGNGNKTSSTYQATPTSKNTTSYTYYNQYSFPTQMIDELGNTRTYTYDANYNPQKVTVTSNGVTSVVVSTIYNSNVTVQAEAIGHDIGVQPAFATQNTYDSNGNKTSSTDALGRTTSYTYDALSRKLSMIAPTPTSSVGSAASTTTYTYDALGNIIQTVAPLGRITSSAYDANGNKIADTDARGNTTSYVYDALNRLVETDFPDHSKITKSYDFRNNVIDEIDQNGNDTHFVYDLDGREISATGGYGSTTPSTISIAYDADGRKNSVTDAAGNTNNYTYDSAGRLTTVSGSQGASQIGYDDASNRISLTDALNNMTHFVYDSRNRMVKTVFPDGTSIASSYDDPGNLTQVIDQAGNTVQYTYDAANQLKSVIQVNHPNPSNNTNSYSYDQLGNLIILTDEKQHSTQNAFDLLNEPVQKTLPDGQLNETRSYDAAGNLLSLTHFNGVVTTYTYDTLNRLTSRTTPGEAAASFTYTPTGKYLTSTGGDGTVNYFYNSLDQLVTKATPEGTLSYTYYPTGKVETVTSSNANGVSVTYAWDDLNRLSTVVDHRLTGQNTTSYNYDSASNVASVATPNGLQSSFTYDALNRLTAMNAGAASYSYQLGPTGSRTSATEGNGRSQTWNYDGIYRLTGETISNDPANNNGSVSYGLDSVGNRSSQTSTLPGINSGNWSYNADDQISSETYDSNGNVIAAGAITYAYNSQNQMISAIGNGKVITMVYDAFGNRVSKTVNGVSTQYLVEDDVNPTGLAQVLEEVQNGTAIRTYTYGLQRIDESQFIDNVWSTNFYVYDGSGSVRQLTDSTGKVTDEYEYDAYGNSFVKSGSTPNNYLYRGEDFDNDLGLYYLRARYYDPATGRFLSRDPKDGNTIDPKTLHKYLYADADPENMVDPTGNEALAMYADMLDLVELEYQGFKEGPGGQLLECAETALNSTALVLEEISSGNTDAAVAEATGTSDGMLSCITGIPAKMIEFMEAHAEDKLNELIEEGMSKFQKAIYECAIVYPIDKWLHHGTPTGSGEADCFIKKIPSVFPPLPPLPDLGQ